MKPNVLVVDDDAAVLEALGKLLWQAGYNVVTASDGPEAVERFGYQRTDLLVLDIHQPFKHGWEAFGHLTSLSPGVPIIVITSRSNKYPAALMAGASALMEKPVDADRLLRIISDLLVGSEEPHVLVPVVPSPAPDLDFARPFGTLNQNVA